MSETIGAKSLVLKLPVLARPEIVRYMHQPVMLKYTHSGITMDVSIGWLLDVNDTTACLTPDHPDYSMSAGRSIMSDRGQEIALNRIIGIVPMKPDINPLDQETDSSV